MNSSLGFKPTYSLRTVFMIVTLAAVLFAGRFWYVRFIATPYVTRSKHSGQVIIEWQPTAGHAPCRFSDHLYGLSLDAWLAETEHCWDSPVPLDCEMKWTDRAGRVQSSMPMSASVDEIFSSTSSPKFVYVVWNGHIRRGDGDDLRQLLVHLYQPCLRGVNSDFSVWHADENGDGKADKMVQSIDSESMLVWQDTDLDGTYDRDVFWEGSNEKWVRQIAIPVPTVPWCDEQGDPLSE